MEDMRNSIRDLALGNLSPEDSLRLLEIVEKDPELSQELELATSLINLSAEEGKELFGERLPSENHHPKRRYAPRRLWSTIGASRGLSYLGYALGALSVIVVGLSLSSYYTSSPYAALASLGGSEGMDRLRGSGQQDLVLVYDRSISGKHEETISLLERYLRHHPRSEVTGFVRLALGEQYLLSARTATLMLFHSVDASKVERAFYQLDKVIASGENDRMIEEAYWLRAKGALMLERPDSAMSDLYKLLRLRGRLSLQAEHLLTEIVRITSTR